MQDSSASFPVRASAAPSGAGAQTQPGTKSASDPNSGHHAQPLLDSQLPRAELIQKGIITNDFAPPERNWLSGHRGIDFAAPPATPVLAISAGVISFVGKVGGKPVITVAHSDGLRSTYEPVLAEVKKGDVVARGAVLGYTDTASSSHCSARCVHIGLLDSQTYKDPWPLITARPRIVLKHMS